MTSRLDELAKKLGYTSAEAMILDNKTLFDEEDQEIIDDLVVIKKETVGKTTVKGDDFHGERRVTD